MAKESIKTRSELPYILAAIVLVLVPWRIYNDNAGLYKEDLSEGGKFELITYGSDHNPARAEQMNIFNRYHRKDGLKVALDPGASDFDKVLTRGAANNLPDIIDCFTTELVYRWADKGLILPINDGLKKLRDEHKVDITKICWPTRLDDLRVDNPDWQEGQDPLDRWTWYGVPNNLSVNMVLFNKTLYDQVKVERQAKGESMPPEPWLHWTWWDYAALAKAMHRRAPSGRFLSFGGALPNADDLYVQIGSSMRGTKPEAFAALSDADKKELGLDPSLSYEDCITFFKPHDDGMVPYPNQEALRRAMQYRHDMLHLIKGAPSKSDSAQIANVGGFGGGGAMGQFKSGTIGMFFVGRWFLGQVRSDVSFEWRLLRMPRWVPYKEWQSWQQRELEPAKRDGAWGETTDPLRGYAGLLGGRISCVTSSAKDPKQAFTFLSFLVANEDYNKVLLLEDGLGANMFTAREYLSKPDPLFPAEVVRRPVEHELGALENLYPNKTWPYPNWLEKWAINGAAESKMADDLNAGDTMPAGDKVAQVAYAELGVTETSRADIGQFLADIHTKRVDDGLKKGLSIDMGSEGPGWQALLFLVVIAAGLGVLWWSQRRADDE